MIFIINLGNGNYIHTIMVSRRNWSYYELESSRVRYDADAEQRRASARDMYRANLESNRASKRWQQEKNSVAVRASKMRRYELNSGEKRSSKAWRASFELMEQLQM